MNQETTLMTSSLENNIQIDELKLKDKQYLKDHKNQPGIYIIMIEPKKDDEYIYLNVGSASNITEKMIHFKSIYKNAYLYLFHPTNRYLELGKLLIDEFLSQNIKRIVL